MLTNWAQDIEGACMAAPPITSLHDHLGMQQVNSKISA